MNIVTDLREAADASTTPPEMRALLHRAAWEIERRDCRIQGILALFPESLENAAPLLEGEDAEALLDALDAPSATEEEMSARTENARRYLETAPTHAATIRRR